MEQALGQPIDDRSTFRLCLLERLLTPRFVGQVEVLDDLSRHTLAADDIRLGLQIGEALGRLQDRDALIIAQRLTLPEIDDQRRGRTILLRKKHADYGRRDHGRAERKHEYTKARLQGREENTRRHRCHRFFISW